MQVIATKTRSSYVPYILGGSPQLVRVLTTGAIAGLTEVQSSEPGCSMQVRCCEVGFVLLGSNGVGILGFGILDIRFTFEARGELLCSAATGKKLPTKTAPDIPPKASWEVWLRLCTSNFAVSARQTCSSVHVESFCLAYVSPQSRQSHLARVISPESSRQSLAVRRRHCPCPRSLATTRHHAT